MRFFKLCLIIVPVFLVLPAITACTSDDEKKEKGKVKQLTDKTAEKIVNYIKTPLEKASETAENANQRNEAIKRAEEERAK